MNKIVLIVIIILVLLGIFLFTNRDSEIASDSVEEQVQGEQIQQTENDLETDDDIFSEIDGALEYIN